MCMSSQVVMTLMEPLLNKGHCLSTDNFYSSPELADILIQSLTDMYGTLKPRRKDVPKELLSKKIDKGQMIAYQRRKVCVMKWMDKKAVCLISTIHNPEMVQVQSHKNEIRRKPKAVMEYNNTIGGVDRLDQHLTNYPLIKKRGKKMDIVDCLIERYGKVSGKKGRPALQPNPMRLTERHFLEVIAPSEKKLRPARKCYVCSLKKNDNGKRIRKETRYFCPDCDVGLCLTPCFKLYHTKLDL
ncbi:piggyBac transposable element-derived protein 4 [Trichonephila clavipes]|nr:piggyBac transposable element-derived protein 4 [Trichonephila clavipes]